MTATVLEEGCLPSETTTNEWKEDLYLDEEDDEETVLQRRRSDALLIHLCAAICFFYEGSVCFFFEEPFHITVVASIQYPQELTPSVIHSQQLCLQYVLVVYFFFSGLSHMLLVIMPKYYTSCMEQECSPIRWVGFALSAPFVGVSIALLMGVCEIGSLCFIGMSVFATNLFGLLSELYQDTNIHLAFAWLSFFPFWLFVFLVQSPSTTLFPFAAPSKHHILIIFPFFGLNHLLNRLHVWLWKSYLFADMVYVVASVLCKSIIGYLCYAHFAAAKAS